MSAPSALFNVTAVSMRHAEGTKEYHLLLITRDGSDKGVCVRRWGKTATFGQMQFSFSAKRAVTEELDQYFRVKSGRGYRETERESRGGMSLAGVRALVGSEMWRKLQIEPLFRDWTKGVPLEEETGRERIFRGLEERSKRDPDPFHIGRDLIAPVTVTVLKHRDGTKPEPERQAEWGTW